ncbi:hypothetical protein [Flavobacterium mesophilum]|uniref:hypothetical protein n=1 Tax=Flavobacterium mesophilum TaxID=3143495 RepID=UPI0031D38A0A
MSEIITIKNKQNWIVAIILPFALFILLFIIVILLPINSTENTYLLSILHYFYNVGPFLAFFILFLYIWLWNTFGSVILEISPEKIKVTNKYKLFNKPQEFHRCEIEKISILDLGIEKTKYYTRLNYLFSKSYYSIVIQKDGKIIRIVDWLNHERANNILQKMNQKK